MGVKRPGGTELTEYALEQAGLQKGARLLDVGCGDGTAALFIQERFGAEVIGIDFDEKEVQKAKTAGLDARVQDASMLEFPSKGFDVVLMECVFSVLDRQEEAIHEAYCMLKNGGKLVITDVYCREPDMERFRKDHAHAMALFRRPRQEKDCETEETLPSPYCQDGAVVMKGLEGLLSELEMEIRFFEDRTEDLKAYCGQAIFDRGMNGRKEAGEEACGLCDVRCAFPGYFLLIAQKK